MQGSQGAKRLQDIAFDRRTALKISGGSVAAAVLGSAMVLDTAAQETSMEAGFTFLTTPMADTIGAIAEQYWPTTEASAGAIDAGVVTYIDRALAGPYSGFQNTYRVGLGWIDALSNEQFGANFVGLDAAQQLELLTAVFDESISYPAAPVEAMASPVATAEVVSDMVATPEVDEGGAQVDDGKGTLINATAGTQAKTLLAFLNTVRAHTMEGLFSDPVHGGNRNFAGWIAVGYPGPYVYYDEAQQQSFEPLDQPLQSIADF
jgi:gluconate 2-dehydrogenase gamma chain